MKEMKENFKAIFESHQKAVEKSASDAQFEVLEKISRAILKALKSGNKILFCGNGGSAADSQHVAAELIGRFKRNRKSLPAIALTTDTSILTAVANDYDFSHIFSRQVEGLGIKGDILIGISTSGNSKNILEAVNQAKTQEIFTVGFTGDNGGALKDICDLCFRAQSSKTPHIQEVHITAFHAICEVVEDVLFGA